MRPNRNIQPSIRIDNDAVVANAFAKPAKGLKLPPRVQSVKQACRECRAAKSRCDGRRPVCASCVIKNRQCEYDAPEGQSTIKATRLQLSAVKTRLESFERLLLALRTSAPDEATKLLDCIRAGDDPMASSQFCSGTSSNAASSPAGTATLSTYPCSCTSGTSDVGATYVQCSLCYVASTRATSTSPDKPAPQEPGASDGARVPSLQHVLMSRLIPSPPPPSSSFLASPILLPDFTLTKTSMDSFFNHVGRLFYVYSREQAEQCFQAATSTFTSTQTQQEAGDMSSRDTTSICVSMAIAAVGAQYTCGECAPGVDKAFYNVARYHVESLLEQHVLHAIKVCTLLAMYNIMNKPTTALAYIETGLSLGRKLGLAGTSCPSTHAETQWADCKKMWRTLTICSSWISTSIGYIPGNDVACDNLSLSDLHVEDIPDLFERIQIEMAKICVIKATILHLKLNTDDATTLYYAQSILESLQRWHRELPEEMQLLHLGNGSIPPDAQRSILLIHLLYLGAMMLLYRRLLLQQLQIGGSKPESVRTLFAQFSQEAILSATTASRILKLLLEEDSIIGRCWMSISHAHTACLIILHSAAQKQLHGFSPAVWSADLEHAKYCLTVLEFSAPCDPVAASHFKQLSGIHASLAQYTQQVRHGSLQDVVDGLKKRQGFEFSYLVSLPADADQERLDIAISLFVILCDPFGHASQQQQQQQDRTTQTGNDALLDECPPAEMLRRMLQASDLL